MAPTALPESAETVPAQAACVEPGVGNWWVVVVLVAACSAALGALGLVVGYRMLADVPHPAAGLIVGGLGLVYLMGGVCTFIRRPWAYQLCTLAGLLLAAAFPIGTLFGLGFLYGLKKNRHRYLLQKGSARASLVSRWQEFRVGVQAAIQSRSAIALVVLVLVNGLLPGGRLSFLVSALCASGLVARGAWAWWATAAAWTYELAVHAAGIVTSREHPSIDTAGLARLVVMVALGYLLVRTWPRR